jgi:hypothetical protein
MGSMNGRKRDFLLAAAAAGLLAVATTAGAQATGTTTAQAGFNVEGLLAELSCFVPEEYAGFGARGILFGGPGDAPTDAALRRSSTQGQGAAQASPQGTTSGGGQRPQGFDLPQFRREAKLMLTAKQVDALLPVLRDLATNPYPTPSQAKKITAAVEATLTKQQKDAYDRYVKERDKALEELRKQLTSRVQGQAGAQGGTQGGFVMRGENGGAGDGQRQGGQRQQVDPAELRTQMLAGFIESLTKYRATLK